MEDAQTFPGFRYVKKAAAYAVFVDPRSSVTAKFGIVVADRYGRLWVDFEDEIICIHERPWLEFIGNKSPRMPVIEDEQHDREHADGTDARADTGLRADRDHVRAGVQRAGDRSADAAATGHAPGDRASEQGHGHAHDSPAGPDGAGASSGGFREQT